MAVLGRKAVNLVLDRRAVTRPDAFDHAGVHRRAIEVGADDGVRLGVGAGDPARQLWRMLRRITKKREHRQWIVRTLLGQLREIDGLAVKPRRRAGLQPADRQLQFAQTCGQRDRRRIPHATAGIVGQTDMNQAVEEGAGSQHHRARSKAHSQLGHHTGDMVAIEHQIVTCLREDRQIGLVLDATADRLSIQHAICLRTRRAHGRPLACIENPELDACFIVAASPWPRPGHRFP
jgi:hypothetical protein